MTNFWPQRRLTLFSLLPLTAVLVAAHFAFTQVIPESPSSQEAQTHSVNGSASGGELHFRSRATLVQVPVLVTKRGDHVSGLTPGDFHVFEDGKQQRVTSFEEIRILNHRVPAAPPANGEFTNLHSDEPQIITIVALDLANTSHVDQVSAREQFIRYLADNLSPDERIALVSGRNTGRNTGDEIRGKYGGKYGDRKL
jgi:hypothetical protein